MNWQTVAVFLGGVLLLCSFVAVHRYLGIVERKVGSAPMDSRVSLLEREIADLKKAILAGTSPFKKASF